MLKEPRKKLSGKEARYILLENRINLAWLSEQLGIKPQSLQSRLNATEFKLPYQLEINNVIGKRIFDIDMANTITETKGLSTAYINICIVEVRTIVRRAVQMQQVRYETFVRGSFA